MHNRYSSYCITSFITQGYSCHFLTNTCFQQWWMFLKQYCNTSWFQTARLLLGTGKTVYTFLHQTCEAYLLVVRLQKGVKKKKVGKGIRRNFRTHGSFYIFKHLQSLPSTPRNGLYRNYRFCSLKIPAKLKEAFPINWEKPSNYINQKVYHTNLTFLR